MRVFDLMGAVAVAAWIGLIGLYVHHLHSDGPETRQVDGDVVLHEGESWMVLTRDETDVGYIHQTQTRLEEGWLLEYDFLMSVALLGVDQTLETKIKATVDAGAVLRKFSASLRAGENTFGIEGRVDGQEIVMTLDMRGEPQERRIQVQEPPRLASSAFNQLIARDDLEPGTVFEQEYFDPTALGMRTMRFEFVRRRTIDVYETKVDAYHFRQKMGGAELDVYIDAEGIVHIQEFPLRIVGARLPDELAKSRVASIRRKLTEQEKSRDEDAVDLGVEAALGLLQGEAPPDVATSRFQIAGLEPEMALDLDSQEQRVVARHETYVVIDTKAEGEATPLSEEDRAAFLEMTARVDGDTPAIEELVEGLAGLAPSHAAAQVARRVADRLQSTGNVAVQTASQALLGGTGDCTEHALVLVAALRRLEIPARFVSGVRRDEKGRFVAHQWAQYYDGERFLDLDATRDDGRPTSSQLQLFTHDAPEHPQLLHALDVLRIGPAPAESDFN